MKFYFVKVLFLPDLLILNLIFLALRLSRVAMLISFRIAHRSELYEIQKADRTAHIAFYKWAQRSVGLGIPTHLSFKLYEIFNFLI